MKISELLLYRMQVEDIAVETLLASTNLVTNQIKDLLTDPLSDAKNLSKLSVSSSINAKTIEKQINLERSRITSMIDSLESNYLTLSNQIAPKFYSEEISQKIQNRPFDNDFEKFMISISKKYADYRYSGCELFPANEDFTKNLVAFEPLYLMDPNQTNLDVIVSKFNPAYQHKLRTYNQIPMLPKGTLGFVTCVNMFERLDIEIIDQILADLNIVMADGSTFLFTFNDCNHWRGATLVESGAACYQTEKLLRTFLEKNNFSDIKFSTFKDHMAYVEVKKLGDLTTIKSSSAIGRVVNINSLT
jgi:hypothetical protein